MAGQAKKIDIIYVDTMENDAIVVTIGDTIRGADWARKEYPDEDERQESRGGMYAVFLAAKRAGKPHTQGGWLDWLDIVTMPEDEAADEVPAEGEDAGLSSTV